MNGPLFALLTSMSFAADAIFSRRAVLKVPDASIGTLISVPLAVPFFLIILAISGQVKAILSFSWKSYFWLSMAGILFFVVGRSLSYQCIQLVGANIASILRRVNILVSVVIGIIVLQEPLSWRLALGVLLIIVGISLPAVDSLNLTDSIGQFSRIPVKAFVLGFGNGAAWGIAPIFVKLGIEGSQSPIAGAFVSFLAATVVLHLSLLSDRRRSLFAHIPGRSALLFFISGLLACIANLLRYVALSISPASVVVPIVSITPVFLLAFSFLLNRKLEIFSRTVIIGTFAVVAGTILLV